MTPWPSISSSQRRPCASSSSTEAARVAATVERMPPPGREDLEVAGAALAQHQLALARAAEQEVRVRVDEARRDRAAVGVDPGEPPERVALRLERGLDRGARPDRRDPALPAGDDRGVGRVGAADVGGGQPPDLALAPRPVRSPPASVDDLGRADDQEAGRRLVDCGRPR